MKYLPYSKHLDDVAIKVTFTYQKEAHFEMYQVFKVGKLLYVYQRLA